MKPDTGDMLVGWGGGGGGGGGGERSVVGKQSSESTKDMWNYFWAIAESIKRWNCSICLAEELEEIEEGVAAESEEAESGWKLATHIRWSSV